MDVSPVADTVAGIVALLLMAVTVLALTKRIRLPFTVALVIVGITLSAVAEQYPAPVALLQRLQFTPDLILYVFLPTLLFAASFNMDVSRLRHNLGAVLGLAVPGLLLSTLVIGLLVWLATPIPLAAALLLGAILSATDPVAVIGVFQRLGAPQRLGTLVEGESLFNDATAIVLSRILVGLIAAGTISAGQLGQGVVDFFGLFIGGIAVGTAMAWLTGKLLSLVEADSFIEISLTTILAYGSFLVAEEIMHVSGVMATVSAGLTLGGWGRIKISAPVRGYLENFWEYLAFVANGLVFLMIGLRVDLGVLAHTADLLAWVILAMLTARALVIYGLMPLVGRLPGSTPVSRPYQTVIFWGGLRGAIALALVMSLPDFEWSRTLEALVTGAVLFTLVVQGLTIEPLVRWLGLDRPRLSTRLALLERDMEAHRRALDRMPRLLSGSQFLAPVAEYLTTYCTGQIRKAQQSIRRLRETEMTQREEARLLYLRAFGEERSFYEDMYAKGHLTEGAYRELTVVLGLQADAVRYHGRFEQVHSHRLRRTGERAVYRLLNKGALLRRLAERLRRARVLRNYEEVWAHYLGSGYVLGYLGEIAGLESIPGKVLQEVRAQYLHWHSMARENLDRTAAEFPELTRSMQQRFGMRMLMLAKADVTEEQARAGLIPHSTLEKELSQIRHYLNQLRGEKPARLRADPGELLARVPLFGDVPFSMLNAIAETLIPYTLADNETVFSEGEPGESLYLIGRGVARVLKRIDGEEREIATLAAGDFFGETAWLHDIPRSATVRTVTPCLLYELRKEALETLSAQLPVIREKLEEMERARGTEDRHSPLP